ncbi:MAG: hypothetical protein FWD68_21160 [Alphaproteobacteria bacterium]|nr:hypothetical protein [Alphaproteobacteria bacterium]
MSNSAVQCLTPRTVMRVREAIYAHGRVATENTELLLRFAREFRGEVCPEWDLLFNEVLTDYVVRQNEPPNVIPDYKADWLTKKLGSDGGITSQLEFDMLLEVMAKAEAMPASLSVFVLNVVKAAIMSGSRDAVTGEEAPPGVVTSADVDALRAVLFAATIGSGDPVCREQVEVLFDIAHAATEVDSSFDELFVRAAGNYLMATRAIGVDVTEALRFDAWLETARSPESFLMGVAGSGAWIGDRDEIHRLLLQPFREALREEGRVQGDMEAGWLIAHLRRQGEVSSAEKRLLKLLGVEVRPVVPPAPPVQVVMKNSAIVVPRHSEAAVPGRVEPVAPRHSEAVAVRQAHSAVPKYAEPALPGRGAAVSPCHSEAVAARQAHSVVPKYVEPALPGRGAAVNPRHPGSVVPKRAEPAVPVHTPAAAPGDGVGSEPAGGEGRSWSLISIDWGSGA